MKPRLIPVLALAAITCSCSISTVGSDGGDAAPDAAATMDLNIRVTRGDSLPLTPASGMRVRVSNASGFSVEGTTDNDGRLATAVPRERGPYEITVANVVERRVISIVGVTAPLTDSIHFAPLELSTTVPPPTQMLSLNAINVPTNATVVSFGGGGIHNSPEVLVDNGATRPTNISVESTTLDSSKVHAIAWITTGAVGLFSRALGATLLDLGPRSTTPRRVDMDFSNSISPQTTTYTIALPTTGILLRANQQPIENVGNAMGYQWPVSSLFRSNIVAAGEATATAGTDPSIRFDWFPGELAPDVFRVEFANGISNEFKILVKAGSVAPNNVISIPPIQRMEVSGTAISSAKLTVEASDYSFSYCWMEANAGWSWVVFAAGSGAMVDRVLPQLPTGIAVQSTTPFQVGCGVFNQLNNTSATPWSAVRFRSPSIEVSKRLGSITGM